jgi:hypothetical protein
MRSRRCARSARDMSLVGGSVGVKGALVRADWSKKLDATWAVTTARVKIPIAMMTPAVTLPPAVTGK